MSKKFNDASIATVTSLTTSRYLNSVDPSTGELDKITVANAITQFAGGGPLEYIGIVSQSGTSAPGAVLVKNTLGTSLTFSRNIAGDYNATAGAAVFTANKTVIFITNGSITQSIGAVRVNDTVINFVAGGDNNLQNANFKIQVYP